MFTKLESLIGNDNLSLLNSKHVLIVGIGGVGGYALESLVRSNIGEITIVDPDIIDITNLNRQIISNQNNIGFFKVDEAKIRALSINPNIKINKQKLFIDETNIEELFKSNYDYVIDACDNVNTKLLLVNKCFQLNIKIISCMGTANKMDPSKLTICDISKTSYDPLARIVRNKLKSKKLMVISSTEELSITNNNVLGTNSFVPATAGLLCASYIVNETLK